MPLNTAQNRLRVAGPWSHWQRAATASKGALRVSFLAHWLMMLLCPHVLYHLSHVFLGLRFFTLSWATSTGLGRAKGGHVNAVASYKHRKHCPFEGLCPCPLSSSSTFPLVCNAKILLMVALHEIIILNT